MDTGESSGSEVWIQVGVVVGRLDKVGVVMERLDTGESSGGKVRYRWE